MGNFYTNHTLRTSDQRSVIAALEGRSAYVSPARDGCVVVFDEESDSQNPEVVAELSADLSRVLDCAVLAVLNHDDDILWYLLHQGGVPLDQYDSTPGYFDNPGVRNVPTGGDAGRLCAAFGVVNVADVEQVLRKKSGGEGYVFAVERHAYLCQALGLPIFGVGTGYRYIDRGETPEGMSEAELVKVTMGKVHRGDLH